MRIGKGIGAAVLSALLCTAMLFLPTTAFAENLNATDQIGMVRSNVPYLMLIRDARHGFTDCGYPAK